MAKCSICAPLAVGAPVGQFNKTAVLVAWSWPKSCSNGRRVRTLAARTAMIDGTEGTDLLAPAVSTPSGQAARGH